MRGLLGYVSAFRGNGVEDRERPNPNIGMAFLAAAVVVAVVGFQWMASDGDDDSRPNGWTLGDESAASGGPTTIPASPAAVAVRIGADRPDQSSTESSGSTLPDGTPIAPVPDPSTTGSTATTLPPGSSSTTIVTTVDSTEPPTSSTDPPSSTEPPTSATTTTSLVPPAPSAQSSGLIGGLVGGVLGSLGALITP